MGEGGLEGGEKGGLRVERGGWGEPTVATRALTARLFRRTWGGGGGGLLRQEG